MSAEVFTAHEIALALGKTRRAVRRLLACVAPDGAKIVRGNSASAWSLDALPAAIRAELREIAGRKVYRSEADVLRNPPERYESPTPLADIDPGELVKAQKLQRALAAALALPGHVPPAEQAARAMQGYRSEFGHGASDRTVSDHLKRVINRDGGLREFHRIELYIAEEPALKRTPERRAERTKARLSWESRRLGIIRFD